MLDRDEMSIECTHTHGRAATAARIVYRRIFAFNKINKCL